MSTDRFPSQPRTAHSHRGAILAVVLIYAVVATLWILLSDKVLQWLFSDPEQIILASALKGGLFVAVTSWLLYELMRRMVKPTSPMQAPDLQIGLMRPSLPFALLATAVVALTAVGVVHIFTHQRDKEVARLQTIAELKARQIGDWLKERKGEAGYIPSSTLWQDTYRRWREEGDTASRDQLRARLDEFCEQDDFEDVMMLEEGGELLWRARGEPLTLSPALLGAVRKSVGVRGVVLLGPYRDAASRMRLDFIASLPMVNGHPGLAIVFRIDPTEHLFSILRTWPVPSTSGETLLFRRDGDEVMFLNELRHRKGAAATLRMPVATAQLLAAQVLRGEVKSGGLVKGKDYRGAEAIGMVHAIPGTDWFLLAKLDSAELYGEARHDAVWIGLAGLMALLMTATGFNLLRQRQQLALAAGVQQSQADRLRALGLLAAIADSSEDAIFAKDLEGRFILFNRAACAGVGKPVEEILGHDEYTLFPPEQAEKQQELNRRVIAENRAITQEEALDLPAGQRIVLSTKGPLRDTDGQVIGIFGISRDITEQKRAEQELVASESRFRALVEQSLAGIYIIQDGNFRYVNPGFAAIFGYDSPDDVIDRVPVADLVCPEDRGRVLENIRRRVDAETPDIHYTFAGLRHDGSRIEVEVHGRAFDYQGRPAVIGLILDITARKAAEDSLRESELRFHDIVNASADWVWEVDAEGRYTYASESVHDLLGYTSTEILGKTPFDLMPPEEAARVSALFSDISARGVPFRDLDNINLHKDGTPRHVQTNGMPILDARGRLLGYRGLDRDITEKKLAEEQLRASEERLQLTLDATSDGLWDWDLRSGALYLTQRYYEMSGYRPEQVIPDFEFFKRTVYPEDLPHVLETMEAHLRGESPDSEFDYRLVTASGEIKWVRGRGRVVERDDGGAPLRMVGTITDISARKLAEEALHRQTAELAQRNAELERFNRATVGRELQMITLKQQVNALSRRLGEEPPYPLAFLDARAEQPNSDETR